jgi:hypothetical protein
MDHRAHTWYWILVLGKYQRGIELQNSTLPQHICKEPHPFSCMWDPNHGQNECKPRDLPLIGLLSQPPNRCLDAATNMTFWFLIINDIIIILWKFKFIQF